MATKELKFSFDLIDDWIKEHTPHGSEVKRDFKILEKEAVLTIHIPGLSLTEEQIKLFQSFRPTSYFYEPITMARGFLSAVGGKIDVSCSKDTGTKFLIRLDSDAYWANQLNKIKQLEKSIGIRP